MNGKMIRGAVGLVGTVLLGTHAASAAVMYVDATSGVGGNTTLSDGSAFTPPLNGTTGLDNNWEQRTTFGSSGNIFESAGEGGAEGENAPELRTTIGGLTPGQEYQVYVFFWDPTSTAEDWNLRAGLTSGSPTLFARADATSDPNLPGSVAAPLANTLTYSTSPTVFLEGSRDLLAANLGTALADGNGQIAVFIDDNGAAGTVNRRSWYDGVGAEAIPEPASLALLSLSALFIGRRRRMRPIAEEASE